MEAKTLNRREFIETSGNLLLTAAGSALFASLLNSCSKNKNPTQPGSDTKTFTLTLSNEASLQQVGGFKTYTLGSTPVITFRVDNSTFITLSLVCTHQGTTINWQTANNHFLCPNHGSQFDKDGKVIKGPASSNLETFATVYNSTTGEITVTF